MVGVRKPKPVFQSKYILTQYLLKDIFGEHALRVVVFTHGLASEVDIGEISLIYDYDQINQLKLKMRIDKWTFIGWS